MIFLGGQTVSALHPVQIAAELKTYPFFSGFPDDALLVFATMAVPVDYQPGHFLLQQGKTNSSLFFLRKGRLLIQVDGENVSELSTPGEVLGEMSLINRKPVAASVKVVETASVFEVNEEYLKSLAPNEQQKFQNLLYRVYAGVLAERLLRTNEKAKRFEIAHRDLETAHETLRKVNENLEHEIARRSKELVQKVRSLTESHLQPTQTLISHINQVGLITAEEGHKLSEYVGEVIDFLKPVGELRQRGEGGHAPKVLLCDANKKQQNIARLSLGGTGVDLSLASSVDELEGLLNAGDFDLILCDAEMELAADKIAEKKPKTPLVVLVNLDMAFYLQTLKKYPKQPFFVSRDVNNKAFTIKNISTTVGKILNQDFFGIDKYLSWGSKILEKQVVDADGRADLIEKMKEHFQGFGIRSAILDRVHTVAEEILMNAIYDAPVGADGKALYNHLARSEKVILKPEHQSKFRYGTDGNLLAISVADPFGALPKEIIMRYLESGYAGQEIRSADKGGAGRGLHMMIESSDLTVFNVKKGRQTEVISLFNLESARDVETHPTFHLFFG